jgi:homoserine kinase
LTDFRSNLARNEVFELSVPASVANLGPGFDTLAVAVQLYLNLRVRALPGHGELHFEFVNEKLDGEN